MDKNSEIYVKIYFLISSHEKIILKMAHINNNEYSLKFKKSLHQMKIFFAFYNSESIKNILKIINFDIFDLLMN